LCGPCTVAPSREQNFRKRMVSKWRAASVRAVSR
jgi:hypothetical protein